MSESTGSTNSAVRGCSGRAFTIGASATQILEEPEPYRVLFAREHAIVVGGCFEPALLDKILRRCRETSFSVDDANGLGNREVESPQRVGAALNVLLGRSTLLGWLEAVSGHRPLVRAEGRLVQALANGAEHLIWHDDNDLPGRKLGMVISLCEAAYDGGIFEMRRKGTVEPLCTYKHEMAGSALIFDIDRTLEHRVTAVTAGGPRRVYAGWFMQDATQVSGR